MQTTDFARGTNELIAKQNGKGLIILAVLPSIGLLTIIFNPNHTISWYTKNPFGAVFLISTLFILTAYLWNKILDTGVKLKVNEEGIWTKKHGLINWQNIFTYQLEKRLGKTVTYNLKLETKNPGRLIVCDLTFLDKDFFEIKESIELNAKGYNIQFLGILEHEY
ncbi:hypothetical protein V9K67_09200 [Paraflavisolibacter sp. H34]|uniref:hypothetical protein n=1 Tax=Huijunlia imazamoxiresistens TaxID=3127457 RepID=UPI00301A69ED